MPFMYYNQSSSSFASLFGFIIGLLLIANQVIAADVGVGSNLRRNKDSNNNLLQHDVVRRLKEVDVVYTSSGPPPTPLDRCEGDCDNDGHCAGSLVCFERNKDEYKDVPGCSGGSNDGSRTDYCIDPNDLGGGGGTTTAPTKQAPSTSVPTISPVQQPVSTPAPIQPNGSTSSPTSQPVPSPTTKPTTLAPVPAPTGSGGGKVSLVSYGDIKKPSPLFPLKECEGDCDNDDDCLGDLYCWQRGTNGPLPPNCIGTDGSRTDYCARPEGSPPTTPSTTPQPTTVEPSPSPPITAPTTTAPTIQPPVVTQGPTSRISPTTAPTTSSPTAPTPVATQDPTSQPSTSVPSTSDPTSSPITVRVATGNPTTTPTESPTEEDIQPSPVFTFEDIYVPVNPVPSNPPRGYFNYDPSSPYGPDHWDEIDVTDHFLKEFTNEGWGTWEGHLEEREPLRNRCGFPDRNMSPKNLIETEQCESHHEIRTKVKSSKSKVFLCKSEICIVYITRGISFCLYFLCCSHCFLTITIFISVVQHL